MVRFSRVRVLFACGAIALGTAPAFALDSTQVADVRIQPKYKDAQQALQDGIASYRAGNAKNSVEALTYAAQGGEALAQWKLGKMYAAGDGVTADDYKAYKYFLQIVQHYDEDSTPRRELPVVASAFVAVGAYSLNGISDAGMKPNPRRAFSMFMYAATNFGDANAQYNLARMYLDGSGVDKDPRQAARWFRLAAEKGHAPSQALLGHLLFTGPEGIARQRALGLMYLTLARDSAGSAPDEKWIVDLYDKAMSQANDNDRQAAVAYLESYLKRR